ncbi:hypothetical protein NIES4102_42170 (plasmid) [Chondrocystis sp. NIES-4102]|nr:hypothetical protein NIES4102_41100 [Chondrocystis sp. NIES-4102]BAZ47171.1 hypothetical protein NIES4102_42170 [Chondrocystis sp. NIES-4102]
MKIIEYLKPNIESQFKYKFPGHSVNSLCKLKYYFADNSTSKQIIILTELLDNPGASITNAAEFLYPQLRNFFCRKYEIDLQPNAILIEHYQANHYGDIEPPRFSLFDLEGRFKHLSVEDLALIFKENYSNQWQAIATLEYLYQGNKSE